MHGPISKGSNFLRRERTRFPSIILSSILEPDLEWIMSVECSEDH